MKLTIVSSLIIALANQSIAGRIGRESTNMRELKSKTNKKGSKAPKSPVPSGPITYEPGNYNHPDKYLTE